MPITILLGVIASVAVVVFIVVCVVAAYSTRK